VIALPPNSVVTQRKFTSSLTSVSPFFSAVSAIKMSRNWLTGSRGFFPDAVSSA